jgi:crotonobetainyl-CoA:carnitine CoA-transferase CaiB-like acyl-CoA transferase
MEKSGLGYETLKVINPRIIYAVISGYGTLGPWKDKPGQDLLLQSMTGLANTSGNGTNGPVPFGISITDILCGAQLVQGILGALIRRQKKGIGALVEISLMESLLDFQFELLTTYYASQKQPQRSKLNNGHPLLGAPYGIYKTADGYLALAMMEIPLLATTIQCDQLLGFSQAAAFAQRDEIKEILANFLATEKTAHWLGLLQQQGLWAMEVLDWEQMQEEDAYQVLQMEQTINTGGRQIVTTRCPVRINGEKLFAGKPAPQLGADNQKIMEELVTG